MAQPKVCYTAQQMPACSVRLSGGFYDMLQHHCKVFKQVSKTWKDFAQGYWSLLGQLGVQGEGGLICTVSLRSVCIPVSLLACVCCHHGSFRSLLQGLLHASPQSAVYRAIGHSNIVNSNANKTRSNLQRILPPVTITWCTNCIFPSHTRWLAVLFFLGAQGPCLHDVRLLACCNIAVGSLKFAVIITFLRQCSSTGQRRVG